MLHLFVFCFREGQTFHLVGNSYTHILLFYALTGKGNGNSLQGERCISVTAVGSATDDSTLLSSEVPSSFWEVLKTSKV